MNKILTINSLLLVIVAGGSLLWDMHLSLGDLSGLVFAIFLVYASGIFFIINMALFIIYWFRHKKEPEYSYLISAILMPLIALVLAYVGGRIV